MPDSIIRSMDRGEALVKARQFADMAYNDALESIVKVHTEKVVEVQSKAAARGSLLSGGTVKEIADLLAERTKALLQARLDALVEGCESYGVPLDEELSTEIINELGNLRATLL